jgi:hypothetical protein
MDNLDAGEKDGKISKVCPCDWKHDVWFGMY